jgi:hypothetical protein
VAVAVVLLTGALVAALALRPGSWQLALDAWLLALGAVALAAGVAATRGALPGPSPSPFDPKRRRRGDDPERLPQLARLERELAMATGTAFDAHFRLRPLLREIAAHRLATRRGLRLDSGSQAVRQALGDPVWELVRPDRPRPRNHAAPGLELPDVAAAIETLERI